MGGRPMNLHLHIDELVLHGFAPSDRGLIAEALQSQLTRLFTEGGVPPALAGGGTAERLSAGAFHTAASARPETTGARIARAVYGRLATWAGE
jgi:hypothetical protein